ncbi:macrophage mannose receptor 1-like isoform X1 [Perca fluviatilis]|nr:macrophage mannose receptor 1-like isoform X1 [Perca fluviatilis]
MQWSLFVFIVMGQCSSIGGQLYDYHFIGYKMTWEEAQKYCIKNYTDLATVANQEDVQRLRDTAKNAKYPDHSKTEPAGQYPGGAWIGRQNKTTNRVWRWSQPGVEFNKSESKWFTGQPDNVGDQEVCVRMNHGTWDDDLCSNTYKCICYDDNQKTFYISNFTMTWLEAQRFCRKNYTDLISGVKQLEDFMKQPYYANLCKPNELCPFWIGLFRDSDWSWSDGSSFSFRSWDKGEDEHPEKKCAMTKSNGNWSSNDCKKTKPFFCYNDSVILINQSMIWEDALYYCRHHHGDLVSITNLDDQRWVQERAKMASTPYVWLGLRYTCTLDFWFWVSDETVHYTNWGPGQPGDDCNMSGAMARNGTWVKLIDDDKQLNFICSKNKPAECN